jgi:hypothetical protein
MVTDCAVGLAELLPESAHAESDCAADVETAKPALAESTAVIALVPGVG